MSHFYLGIDVSKGYADFVMVDESKNPVMEPFQLDDTKQGHSLLYQVLSRFLQQHPQATIYAAVESTGGYEDNWLSSLSSFQARMNLHCARLNPCGVHNNSKASLNRITTDAISAREVAEYMITHPEKVYFDQEDRLATLRKQYSFISTLTKQKTQLLNQLESLLYSSNPDILAYCRDKTPQWVISLLQKYPTALDIAQASPSSLAKIPYITKKRANELIQQAQNSVASATDKISSQLLASLAQQIDQLQKTINAQTKILSENCPLPEVELLKSFPGIGTTTAVGLLLHIQTVHRFPDVKKFCAYFGVHPQFKESGDGTWAFRMSKTGHPEVRRLLFMIAFSGIKSNPLLRDYYHRQRQKNLSKMAALGACMHKVARVIYGMLKNGQPFNYEVDRQNRERTPASRPSKGRENTQRRYQAYDSKAPVSRRQKQKRREQGESQSAHGTGVRVHRAWSLEES